MKKLLKKSKLVSLFLWALFGIAMFFFFRSSPGIRDLITALCFGGIFGLFYQGNKIFIEIISGLNDRIIALEQSLAHTEAKMD